jgi:hypothetical protein
MTLTDLLATWPVIDTETDGPVACGYCHEVEPSPWLLKLNHWVKPYRPGDYDWCADHGMCISQSLRLNHLHYSLTRGTVEANHLAHQITEAETAWSHITTEPEVITQARERLARLRRPAPQHTTITTAPDDAPLW